MDRGRFAISLDSPQLCMCVNVDIGFNTVKLLELVNTLITYGSVLSPGHCLFRGGKSVLSPVVLHVIA